MHACAHRVAYLLLYFFVLVLGVVSILVRTLDQGGEGGWFEDHGMKSLHAASIACILCTTELWQACRKPGYISTAVGLTCDSMTCEPSQAQLLVAACFVGCA